MNKILLFIPGLPAKRDSRAVSLFSNRIDSLGFVSYYLDLRMSCLFTRLALIAGFQKFCKEIFVRNKEYNVGEKPIFFHLENSSYFPAKKV
jgi:hypothetical protein